MRRALVYLHIAVFLAGFTGLLGRLIALNEFLIVWYRLLITAATFTLMLLWSRANLRLRFRELMHLFGVGAIVAIHWVFFYASLKFSNISIAVVCFSTLGFFSALLEPVFLQKRISLPEMLLGLLTVAGVYLIFHFDTRYRTGIVLGLVCAVFAALFTILNKELVARHSPEVVSFYEMTGGFLVLTILLPLYQRLLGASFSWPAMADWFWLLILAWFCTVLAFYLSVTSLKSVSPFTVNLTYNMEPVYGIALAFIVYHENEQLGISFYAGLALIVVAVIVQTVRAGK